MNKKKQLLLNLALTVFFVAAVIVRGPNLNPLYSLVVIRRLPRQY